MSENSSLAVNDAAGIDGMYAFPPVKDCGFSGLSFLWPVFLIF